MAKPKVLLLDIETAPGTAYIWSLFGNDFIPLERLITASRISCWSGKWYGEKGIEFRAEWKGGQRAMMRGLHRMISKADAVITYNGDGFDLPWIQGQFLFQGFAPPPPIPSIDLYKTVKRMKFQSSKLAYVAPYLGIGEKVANAGFKLWERIESKDPKAQAEMEKYNKQDTRLLGSLYERIKPYIKSHPYLGTGGVKECPACGSKNVQKRGVRRTKAFFIERLHCQECGSWSDGVRSKAGV